MERIVLVLLLGLFSLSSFAQYVYNENTCKIELSSKYDKKIIEPAEGFNRMMRGGGVVSYLPSDFIDLGFTGFWEHIAGHTFIIFKHWIQSRDVNCIFIVSSPYVYTKIGDVYKSSFHLSDSIDCKKKLDMNSFNQLDANSQHIYKLAKDKAMDVKYCTHDEAIQMFNADTVIVYKTATISFDYKFKNHPHRKSLLIQKKDRGYISIDCFFNENGIVNSGRYLKLLTKQIWYND